MMSATWLRNTILGLAFVLLAHPAEAQTQVQLADFFQDIYFRSVLELYGNIRNRESFRSPTIEGFVAAGVLTSAFVTDLGGFPIGSSSGGFTYFFNPTTGVAVRSSESFGPAFAERPLTSGRGKFNFGITYLHRRYDRLEGKKLSRGEVKLGEPFFFSDSDDVVDVVQSSYTATINSDTTTLFATYGVTDRLDLAVAIPFQRVDVDASITTSLLKFTNITPATISGSDSASGIGDIAIRAKYNLLNRPAAAVAAGIDWRVPTGDDNKLLGTGNTRLKLYGAAASKMARIFPHANFGYTFRSEPEDAQFFFGSEIGYTAGAEVVLTPRLTFVGDVIGRSLAEEGRLREVSTNVDLVIFGTGGAVRDPATGRFRTERRTFQELEFNPGDRLNSLLAALGVKFSPGSTFIISGHVLFPLSDAGLQSRFTPVIGVDYTF